MAVHENLARLNQPGSRRESRRAVPSDEAYRPPFRQLLSVLGVDEKSLQAETVSVPVPALLRLLGEILVAEVDEAWYLDRYPDVHAAILAGRTPSAAVHFRAAGYREGRLPGPLPFDPAFYFDQYKDIAAAFDRADAKGLQHHYETRGYFEGRVGVRHHLQDADRFSCDVPRD